MARDGDWPSPLIHPAAFDVLRRARQTVYNTPETFRVFGGFRGLSSKAGKQPNRAGRRGRRRFRGRTAKRLPGLIPFGVRGNVFWGGAAGALFNGNFHHLRGRGRPIGPRFFPLNRITGEIDIAVGTAAERRPHSDPDLR